MFYLSLCMLVLSTTPVPSPSPGAVEWRRASPSGPVTITSPADNPRAREASEQLQRVSDRLDALRTFLPHVQWRKLTWTPRVIKIRAYADSAIFANVALLAVRDLLKGWKSGGSGVQQMRAATDYNWRVRGLFSRPPPPPAPRNRSSKPAKQGPK